MAKYLQDVDDFIFGCCDGNTKKGEKNLLLKTQSSIRKISEDPLIESLIDFIKYSTKEELIKELQEEIERIEKKNDKISYFISELIKFIEITDEEFAELFNENLYNENIENYEVMTLQFESSKIFEVSEERKDCIEKFKKVQDDNAALLKVIEKIKANHPEYKETINKFFKKLTSVESNEKAHSVHTWENFTKAKGTGFNNNRRAQSF